MSIIVLAYHEMGYRCLRALADRGVEIKAVFSHNPDPGEPHWFGSVSELARSLGVPLFTPPDINAPKWLALFRDFAPELIVSVHFRRLVGQEILSVPTRGGVNLHPSLLPLYRGRCPINWQLVHGEAKSGVTLHYMTPRADAGEIIGQVSVDVDADDQAIDLYRKLLPAGESVLLEHLDALLEGTAPRAPQDDDLATTFPGRRPDDGRIDWNRSAATVHNLVRAVAPPWPGAFTELAEGLLWIYRARPHSTVPSIPGRGSGEKPHEIEPGEVALIEDRVYIGTNPGALELLEFKMCPDRSLHNGELADTLPLVEERQSTLDDTEPRSKRVASPPVSARKSP